MKMFVGKIFRILLFQVIMIILFIPFVLKGQNFLKYLRLFKATPVQKAGDFVLAIQTDEVPQSVYLIDLPQDTIIFFKPLEGNLVATKYFEKQNMIYIAFNIQSSGYVQICKLSNPNPEEQREISLGKLLYVYFFDDARRMAYVDQNYKFYIINLDNGEIEFNLADSTDETIYTFNVTRDEKAAALLGGSKIIILDVESKTIKKEYPLYSYFMEKIYLTNNKKYVIKNGYDKKLKIIDIENETVLLDTTKLEADVLACQTDVNDEYLFALFKGGILRVYNFSTFEEIWNFPLLGPNFIVEKEGNKVLVFGRVTSILPPSPLLTNGIVKFDFLEKNYKLLYHFLNNGSTNDIDLTNTYLIQRYVKGLTSSVVKYYVFDLNTGKYIKELDTNYIWLLDSLSASSIRFLEHPTYFYYCVSDSLIIRDIATENVITKYYLPEIKNPRYLKLSPNLRYLFYVPKGNDCPKILDLKSNRTIFTFRSLDSCIALSFENLYNQRPLQTRTPQLVYFSKEGRFLGFFKFSNQNQKFFEIINLETGESVFQKNLEPQFKFYFYFDPDDEKYFYFRYDSLPLAKYNLETTEITFFENNPKNYYYSNCSIIFKIPQRNLLVELYKPNLDLKFWDTENLKYLGVFPLKTLLGENIMSLDILVNQEDSPMLYYIGLARFYAIYIDSLINKIEMDTTTVNIVLEKNFPTASQYILCTNESEIEINIPEISNLDAFPIRLFDIFSREVELSSRINIVQNRIFVSLRSLPNGIYCLIVGNTPYIFLKICN